MESLVSFCQKFFLTNFHEEYFYTQDKTVIILPVSVAAEPSCATDQPSALMTDTSAVDHPKYNVQSQLHITSAPQTPPAPVSITHIHSPFFLHAHHIPKTEIF
jgi:hypothetical protein